MSAAPSRPAANRATRLAVVGGGPAGLMAAEVAAAGGAAVTVYERMPTPGRKLLLAGRGGLNLTHAEPFDALLARYGAASARLDAPLRAFPPDALRQWCHDLGQPTFVGSSRRVFPVARKASPLLRAWRARLDGLGVRLATRHRWTGWSGDGALRFDTPTGEIAAHADAVVLALGGASWPRLGADGAWTATLPDIAVAPLRPANCGFRVSWSEQLRARFAGAPLKRIALRFGDRIVRGEAVLTSDGIEGGAIYALSAPLRDTIAATGQATLHVDLRPDLDADELARRLAAPRRGQSLSTFLRKAAGLAPPAVALTQEALHAGADPENLAALVRAVPIVLTATAPIARAISTAGGIRWQEIDNALMLRRRPGVFVAGEMIDWEAPTGGYLLQACLATGRAAGRGALDWLGRQPPTPGPTLLSRPATPSRS